MVRESGISATKPIFPSYLLPSLRIPFIHRRQSSASSAATSSSVSDGDDDFTASSPSTAHTTPNNSPPTHNSTIKPGSNPEPRRSRLSRTETDTLRCGSCSTDLAFASQIVSKGFTGRHGRAYLVAPQRAQQGLLNLRVGRNESRQLVTGWHVVADISCGTCSTKLGWKYVDAKEASQKYKVGKFILEVERVVTYRSWEDGDEERISGQEGREVRQHHEARRKKVGIEDGEEEEEEIAFDSEDEDECEDVFAGTWDAESVAIRRRSMGTTRKITAE